MASIHYRWRPSLRWKRWVSHVRYMRGAGDLPIRVRIVPNMPGRILGDCAHRGDHYLIRLERHVTDLLRWFALLHEIAHCQSWNQRTEIEHDDCGNPGCLHFGCAYARLWREHHSDTDHEP